MILFAYKTHILARASLGYKRNLVGFEIKQEPMIAEMHPIKLARARCCHRVILPSRDHADQSDIQLWAPGSGRLPESET